MKKNLLFLYFLIFACSVQAQDLFSIELTANSSYQTGENLQLTVTAPSNTPSETKADLWIAVTAEAFPNQWFYLTDNPQQTFSTVPQTYKRNLSLASSQQISWQSSKIDNNMSGYYTVYAVYSAANASYSTLLTQALSNIAVKTLSVRADTGLDSLSSHHCVSSMTQRVLPQKLSETGCVDPKDPRQFAAGLIPYAVNSPLWSDYAEKQRAIALPEHTQIKITADGKWQLPIGSVLIKHFELAGKIIETRILTLQTYNDNWLGYSYEWNEAGTDALLLNAKKDKVFNNQHWQYPSSDECAVCHNKAAGGVLGLENLQFNRLFNYSQGKGVPRLASQLDTLSHLGILTKQNNPEAMPDYRDTQFSLEQRARAYLHANCSYCHRPENAHGIPHDYRYNVSFGKDICVEFDSNNPRNFVIVPKHAELSLLITRMKLRNSRFMMPPLGSTIPDVEGIKLIEDWINAMQACPKS